MHVEVSVALNFLISYLYNKLPRRRVDLFGEELEKGLKQKFEGHWYPDKPFKGSGYRCVRCNGEKVDPVIRTAATNSGLDLQEVKDYIPEEMTLWIDPSEVSYRISEKSPIKVLYSDRHEDEAGDTADREVQAANHTFNPEALSFQPIDSLPSSLSSLSLSPSSPLPPGAWSSSVSPSSSLFSSPLQQPQPATATPLQATFMAKSHSAPRFTAASFAATKFGSTKLKSQAKRPTRLSPTEMGNYFRQQQRSSTTASFNPAPQRPRSLSPRDPRLEFLLDQQHRLYSFGQLSPQGPQPLNHSLQQPQSLAFSPTAPTGPVSPSAQPFCAGEGGPGQNTPSPLLSPNTSFPDTLSPGSSPFLPSPVGSLVPDGHKTFLDSLQQLNAMHSYQGQLQHLLVAN